MSAEQKSLTVIERAVVAIGKKEREAELVKLAGATTDITAITNADGYKQVHAARMVLKNERLEITKAGETARQDAKDFQKAVIAEEKRLIGLIQPEEARLESLQEAWDAAREQERQAKIYAEVKRVADLQERVAELRGNPSLTASIGSILISDHIQDLEEIIVDSTFQEFEQQATEAKSAGLARLRELHAAAIAHEAEAERIRLEREELARLRAEQAERDRFERARLAEEERIAKAAREEADRKARLEREAEAAKQAEALRLERAESERQEAIRREAREIEERSAREERQRQEALLATQREELARQERVREIEERRLADERASFERQQREALEAEERRAAEERAHQERRRLMENRSRPDSEAIVEAVAAAFEVDSDIAAGWIYETPKQAWKNLAKRSEAA